MWMGRVVQERPTIELYKHGITRRYLNLDQDGGAYEYDGEGYIPVELDFAVERVLEGLEDMGWTRETVYDEAFIARKYAALREAGWTVITSAPTAGTSPLPEQHQDPNSDDCDQRQDTENHL